MFEALRKEWQAKVATAVFLIYTAFWLVLLLLPEKETIYHYLFTDTYAVLAFWGGLWGFVISQKWGFAKSLVGKAILMFSLGLFAQVFGQLAYSFYAYYLHTEVPYPSIGDLGYFGSIPLYIYGVITLAKASGVKIFSPISIKRGINFTGKLGILLISIIVPVGMLLASYLLFLKGYEFDFSQPLTIFLDFGYPFGEAIYISLAILTYLLSRKVLGGIMRVRILFILFALLVQFIADYMFLYRASRGLWYAGGPNDYTYFLAYFIMTLALLELNTVYNRIKDE
ncbi:MAG: hypothetical protein ABIB98_01790 [bacterium]